VTDDADVLGPDPVRGPGRRQRYLIAGAWVALVLGALAWGIREGTTPAEATTAVVDAIQNSAWGPIAFVVVYLIRPLILFSATVLTLAGGFLFGPFWGIVLVVIAANASAMVAYGAARWVRGTSPQETRAGRMANWIDRLRRNSFETVLSMRLIYLPYDLVSYSCGAARIHPGAFLAGTAIGSAPATIWMVLLGASLESFDGAVPRIDSTILLISGILLVGGLVLARVLRREEERIDGER
jgi:uncharacterized membrane protein YdjX (TVP38/TMEM64 family)